MNDNANKWNPEERDRIVAVFEWLLKEDKKQNPQNYQNDDKVESEAKS